MQMMIYYNDFTILGLSCLFKKQIEAEAVALCCWMIYYNDLTILSLSCLFEKQIVAEAVALCCWVEDGWLFLSIGVHAMRAAYNSFPIDYSWNKLRVKRFKVTGDKEVGEGFSFTTTEDSKKE
ncbi:uncharacterized protein LOC136080006 [Hydra vulgaris]|uniref:Uncharacterized protein LOC136080006 n=1 Tax=Hydra vulgaris TaxID=6087 RepID=A0ABM4BU82_HYDVU